MRGGAEREENERKERASMSISTHRHHPHMLAHRGRGGKVKQMLSLGRIGRARERGRRKKAAEAADR